MEQTTAPRALMELSKFCSILRGDNNSLVRKPMLQSYEFGAQAIARARDSIVA